MNADPSEISSILAGPKQFVIPVFQRFYSWQEDKWATLWKDILALVEDGDSRLSHFIGPFIIISKSRAHSLSSHFLVIDGQQRLITITVMLSALRDKAKTLQLQDLADSVEANSIIFKDGRGRRQMKIVPRIQDRETLEKIVHGGQNLTGDDSLMAQSYKYFAGKLDSLCEVQSALWAPEPGHILENLYQTIINRLRLVVITLDDYDSPSNVYESLNYKGKPLSDADLIRNYVFMQVALEQQDAFDNNIWRPFESLFESAGQLDTDQLTDFYYRYLIAKTGYFAKSRLYVRFMEYLNKHLNNNNGEQLENVVSELKRFARYYLKVIKADDDDLELNLAFQRLRMLDAQTAIPLIITLYNQYDNEGSIVRISLSEFISMLQAVESFILRRSILRMRTRGYGLDFAQAATGIASSFTSLAEFLANKGWPSDEQVREKLAEFPIYHHEPKKSLLILLEVERAFGHKEMISPENLTLEHVMPQNLNLKWRTMLGPNAEEVHQRYVHTLGNLTLTGYNQTLRDHPFDAKKKTFLKSKIQLNLYFSQVDVWTDVQIRERGVMLAEEFIRIWPRPKTSQNSVSAEQEAYQQSLLP